MRQNGRRFADDVFLDENVWISIDFALKFVPNPFNNIPALVQIMAWCRPGDKPLSGPMMVGLPTRICVTRPQWVKTSKPRDWVWLTCSYCFGIWQTPRYQFYRDACQISERLKKSPISHFRGLARSYDKTSWAILKLPPVKNPISSLDSLLYRCKSCNPTSDRL